MSETFQIVPANARGLYIIALLLISVLVIVFVVLILSLRGARSTQFELSDAGLRIRGDLYGRMIPIHQIQIENARRLDFAEETDFQPSWRTMGTSVGGYNAGWFRLKNGEKALVYLTDRSQVVLIPTTAGYSVLLSVQEPDRFLSRLQSLDRGQ